LEESKREAERRYEAESILKEDMLRKANNEADEAQKSANQERLDRIAAQHESEQMVIDERRSHVEIIDYYHIWKVIDERRKRLEEEERFEEERRTKEQEAHDMTTIVSKILTLTLTLTLIGGS